MGTVIANGITVRTATPRDPIGDPGAYPYTCLACSAIGPKFGKHAVQYDNGREEREKTVSTSLQHGAVSYYVVRVVVPSGKCSLIESNLFLTYHRWRRRRSRPRALITPQN